MEEKMVFKWYCPECGDKGNYDEKVVMTFNSDSMDIYDFVEACKDFARAIGYADVSIAKGFNE